MTEKRNHSIKIMLFNEKLKIFFCSLQLTCLNGVKVYFDLINPSTSLSIFLNSGLKVFLMSMRTRPTL